MERSGFEPRISGFEFDCPTIELSKLFDLLNCLDFPKSKTNIIFDTSPIIYFEAKTDTL